MTTKITIGAYLARRLEALAVKHYFAVPGDYNLILLDQLLKNKNLHAIYCCNEHSMGYAVDGYARATEGLSVAFVTYSVGGLSIMNAACGAFAENLPMLIVSGSPNTNASVYNEQLHHTKGGNDFEYVQKAYDNVVYHTEAIRYANNAQRQIDCAISIALERRKPVYLEIPCNLANIEINSPSHELTLPIKRSDPDSLKRSVNHVCDLVNNAVKPSLIVGVGLRMKHLQQRFKTLAELSGYAVAVMPNAKGFFPEHHKQYIGIYWGPVSSPNCAEVIDSSDYYMAVGPIFTDYTTAGYSSLIVTQKLINVQSDHVVVGENVYTQVYMDDFLQAITKKIKRNNASMHVYQQLQPSQQSPAQVKLSNEKLTREVVYAQLQEYLADNHAVIAETGDSWFNAIDLRLPNKALFEIQMQYGAIGWSVGAALGYALGLGDKRRVIALVGDGSFQMTAVEISTLVRYNIKPILIVINNASYTIEVQIHDGPYNVLHVWDYANMMSVVNGADGNGLGLVAKTDAEFAKHMQTALAHDGPVLLEVRLNKNDVNKHLLEWGMRVAASNSKPPISKG